MEHIEYYFHMIQQICENIWTFHQFLILFNSIQFIAKKSFSLHQNKYMLVTSSRGDKIVMSDAVIQ